MSSQRDCDRVLVGCHVHHRGLALRTTVRRLVADSKHSENPTVSDGFGSLYLELIDILRWLCVKGSIFNLIDL